MTCKRSARRQVVVVGRRMACLMLVVLACGCAAQAAPPVKIPLAVRSFSAAPAPPMPVWTGVPLPRGAVKKVDALRLLDARGQAVPAQFDLQAAWADGSAKWVLVSFQAAKPPAPRTRPTWTELRYTLVADATARAPAPPQPVRVRPDTNDITVTTGPLMAVFNRHGFRGVSQAFLDIGGDGRFDNTERISPETAASGIVAVDARGTTYSSGLGRVRRIRVERSGPMHAVVAFHGDLRDADARRPLLNYAMRMHLFAGSSAVRVVLTIHNPRPAGRSEDGSRWTLGHSGHVSLKSLEYVQAVRFAEGLRRVTLAPEPGFILDRIPLTGAMSVYQDSSGGANWFHRTHVDADNNIPLTFRGYRVRYRGRAVRHGGRASPWLDVADSQWAVSAAMPAFWENFPKRLAADADGTIRVGLWPKRPGGPHEIQGGEQKTHEFWLYFRHRRRRGTQTRPMPLARELMPMCVVRPIAWASADAYAAANVTDPIVPVTPGRFAKYEAVLAAPIRAAKNLFTQREQMDIYGWRNFGDTNAFNEADRTSGPYSGLSVVSHFNNEYDLGFGMLEQAMRNADADPSLARAWWRLGLEALWHEADIDIYHTRDDLAPVYNGGTFTHTAHGVEAARSTHRASPRDEVYGLLEWPWGRGGGTESGHFRNRGICLGYLLTGDRHLLDAANDVRDCVQFKVANDRFAQINQPNRDAGNNMQILLDAYLLTGQDKYLKLSDKIAAAAAFDAVAKRAGRTPGRGDAWQYGLFLKSLARLIEIKAERGVKDRKAIDSYLKYARAMHARMTSARRGRRRRGFGSWSLLLSEVMMIAAELTDDRAEKEKFLQIGKEAFHGLDRLVGKDGKAPFWNSKATTMHLQGGGRHMRWALTTQPATQAATQPATQPATRAR